MPSDPRPDVRLHRRWIAALSAVALLVAACSGPGAGIAERIRAANSPIVREVSFSPAAFPDSSADMIVVYLVDDATDAEALDLWCGVVMPAGADQLPAGNVRLLKGGERGTGGGRLGGTRVLADPVCPAGGSPVPGG
jgi:hypothetical protein